MPSLSAQDVRAILSKTVPTVDWSAVGEEEDLEGAGLDSLDKASVVMEVEREASVTISDDRYGDLRTIRDLCAAGA